MGIEPKNEKKNKKNQNGNIYIYIISLLKFSFRFGNFTSLSLNAIVSVLADTGAAVLERVPGLDGMKIVQIAAGAEHSAVITGKVSSTFSLFYSQSYCLLIFLSHL